MIELCKLAKRKGLIKKGAPASSIPQAARDLVQALRYEGLLAGNKTIGEKVIGGFKDIAGGAQSAVSAITAAREMFHQKPTYSRVGEAIKEYTVPALAGIGMLGLANELIAAPIRDKRQLTQSYNLIKEDNPALEGLSDDQLRKYFEVVETYSPETAKNPLAAGAVINKMYQFQGVDPKIIQDLAAIHKSYQGQSALESAIEHGTKYMAGGTK
jgi:hypothetical protein